MSSSKDIVGFRVPTSRPSRLLARGILWFLHDFGKIVCRVPIDVVGRENLERVDQSIVVANHNSLVDTPVIFMTLSPERRDHTATVGGRDYFTPMAGQPWWERFLRNVVIWFIRSAMNVLLIDRKGGEYSQIDRIGTMLDRGWSLVMFPEATRSRDGSMGRFRHGAAELARRHGVPVGPAHVAGTENVLPPGVRWPQPGRLRVTYGDALRPREDESAAAFTARLRDAVDELAPGQARDAADELREPTPAEVAS